MLERDFGKRSGLKVPPVNIGSMRLPNDLEDAVKLVRHAIDAGMKYIDTSRGYGEVEWVLGKALKDGYREKVILSSKWAPWCKKIRSDDDESSDAVRRRIEEQMKRLDVDYLDYYQVWSLFSREQYEAATAKGGMVEGIMKAKDEGLVGHIGFTTHDSVENMLEYIEKDDWFEIILFTYNLLNKTYEPVIKTAHEKGIGTLIMNPLGGGRLATDSPVLQNLAAEVGAVSPADLAIRYILSKPYVTTIISGIMKPADVDDSIASAERPPFTADQMAVIDRFLERVSCDKTGFCTGCKYCMPCPQGIDIPAVMDLVYYDRYWGLEKDARSRYAALKSAKADACVACGLCEKKCTQHLNISAEMKYAAENYG